MLANIIPPLRLALKALVYYCYAVINTTSKIDPTLVISLLTFSFAPTILYALFVLITTLIASTSLGNAYGKCLVRDSF